MGLAAALSSAILGIYGGGAFSPSQLSGLQLWWRDDSLTFTGSSVTGWTDKSGNGNNGTVNGSVTYNSSDAVFGGKACALGAGGAIQSPSFGLTNNYSVILVANGFSGSPAGVGYYWTRSDANDYLYRATPTHRSVRNTGTNEFNDNNGTWGSFSASTAMSIALLTDGTFAGSTLLLNNTAETLTNVLSPSSSETNTNPFVILNNPSTSTGGSIVKIAEALVYNRKLASTEMNQIFAYQAARYGV